MVVRRSVRSGPRPGPSASERERLAQQRRERAHDELLEVRPDPRAPFPLLRVGNPLHGSEYRVYLPAGPHLDREVACDCTDFAHRDLGTCKHIEAVRLWLAREPWPEAIPDSETTAFAAALWKEVDQRQAARVKDRAPASLAWRRPGAALYQLARPSTF